MRPITRTRARASSPATNLSSVPLELSCPRLAQPRQSGPSGPRRPLQQRTTSSRQQLPRRRISAVAGCNSHWPLNSEDISQGPVTRSPTPRRPHGAKRTSPVSTPGLVSQGKGPETRSSSPLYTRGSDQGSGSSTRERTEHIPWSQWISDQTLRNTANSRIAPTHLFLVAKVVFVGA